MNNNRQYQPRSEKLPTSLEQVTPAWLNRTLRLRYPDLEVRDLEIVEVNNTHTTKLRLALDLNKAAVDAGFPKHVCLKANWSGSPLSSGSGICELEARFYRYFREQLTVPAPLSYYADWDEDDFNQGLVVMEDLALSGVTFCTANEPIGADEMARSLEGIADLHASCWGNGILDQHSWLKTSMGVNSSDAKMYRSLEEHMLYNNRLASRRAVLPGWFLEDPERLSDAYDQLVAYERVQPGPRTLIHGDAHLGNSYVSSTGDRRWLDWQIVRRGTPWRDLNYFMTSSMTVAERRSNEAALLKHYLMLMAARGCEMPGFDQAWEQYCLWPIHGLASFNGSRDEWQLPGSILAGVERFSAAIEDHDSVARMARLAL